MKKAFPGHFRPTQDEFKSLWDECFFAVDANVLLHLYRYSPHTRQALEQALASVKDRLFLPHQAAREFLRNRLGVTAGQADEYTKAIAKLSEITSTLANTKKHPFLSGQELQDINDLTPKLLKQLEGQKAALLDRLNNDEILELVATLFDGKTGDGFSDSDLKAIATDGDHRYQHDVPPGYKDGKKTPSGDPYRKYGDLIIWQQLITKAKTSSAPIIFITDDRKEDWWLEQSGRTIGPRTELREEFIREASKDFWMYTVDKFMEEVAAAENTAVNEEAIAEIIEISEETKAEPAILPEEVVQKPVRPVLSERELLNELSEFLDSHPSDDGAVGLRYFVVNYLGSQNYEINHSYARLNALEKQGLIQIFQAERSDGATTTRVRSVPAGEQLIQADTASRCDLNSGAKQ